MFELICILLFILFGVSEKFYRYKKEHQNLFKPSVPFARFADIFTWKLSEDHTTEFEELQRLLDFLVQQGILVTLSQIHERTKAQIQEHQNKESLPDTDYKLKGFFSLVEAALKCKKDGALNGYTCIFEGYVYTQLKDSFVVFPFPFSSGIDTLDYSYNLFGYDNWLGELFVDSTSNMPNVGSYVQIIGVISSFESGGKLEAYSNLFSNSNNISAGESFYYTTTHTFHDYYGIGINRWKIHIQPDNITVKQK